MTTLLACLKTAAPFQRISGRSRPAGYGAGWELVQFASPATSNANRKAEFDREIVTYWAQQLELGPTQLLLLDDPASDCELFVLTDARHAQRMPPPSLWMSTAQNALSRSWQVASGHVARKVSVNSRKVPIFKGSPTLAGRARPRCLRFH